MSTLRTPAAPLILTIDDEPTIRASIADYLEDFDYRVIEAENGRAGIELISRESPDLVLVDLRMPKIDGLDVLAHVRQHAPNMPVIVISGTGAISDVVEALRLGAWDYLTKPIQELEVLRHAVDKALERARLLARDREYHARLEGDVNARTAELQHANRILTHQRDLIERKSEHESCLSDLSHLSLQSPGMGEYLQKLLERLTQSMPRVHLPHKGAIFLFKGNYPNGRMELAASVGLDAQLLDRLRAMPTRDSGGAEAEEPGERFIENFTKAFIRCCGTATGAQFHAIAPIVQNGQPIGMLVLYRSDDAPADDSETTFLARVCDVLSLGILRRLAEEQAEYLAYSDALTGLANRRLLMDRLIHEVVSAQRQNLVGAVLFFDLDHFKTVNDALGHSAGDELLVEVARRLRGRMRAIDTVARLGGDEFVVLLPALHEDAARAGYLAQVLAGDLLAALAAPYSIQGQKHHLTASAGVAMYPNDGDNPEALLRHADSALYAAKGDGRGTIRFYRPAMQKLASERLQLRLELRQALERDEFELYFQPQINWQGLVGGAEGLLRWNHPRRGLLGPHEFLAVAEESGMILALGEWVTRAACETTRQWTGNQCVPEPFKMAINVSPLQFLQSNFSSVVTHIINASGVDPTMICLEITEGALTSNIGDLLQKMHALRHFGVRLAIDDFGTGYSSLARLKQLPLDELKIDRSFVMGLPGDTNDAAIVDTILTMARRLNMTVTAEGVETVQQLEYLRENGCDTIQGFYFSRPVCEQDFLAFAGAS